MKRHLLPTVLLLTVATSASAEEVELYDYTIKPGDSCVRVAIRELGDRKGYRQIHKYNKLGPLPHKLVPGKILKLPRKKRTPDGVLGDKRGKVQVRSPDSSWTSAVRGTGLFRHWRVGTQQKATASVEFRDRSQLQLREETIVIIYGPSKAKARRVTEAAFLETGALRARLAFPGQQPIAIASAAAMAEFGRGSALIEVDKKKVARVANHGGKPIRVRSKGGKKPVQVAAGFGTKVEKGKEPTPPRPLPPSPKLDFPRRVFPALGGTSLLAASWTAEPQAVRYRVVVSRDAQGRTPVAAGDVTETGTSVAGLPPGRYFLTVASVDADGFEGTPSPPAVIEVAAADAARGAAPSADQMLPLGSKLPKVRVPAGTRLAIPATISCVMRVGNEVRPATVTPDQGPVILSCVDGRGDPLPTIAVEIGS
ncbi:MAG: hypothetical protein KJO07_12605 [Deltaproteobacteria bacterium]|nr:hypothetical protein [Deltaproteobacteria bacterium]